MRISKVWIITGSTEGLGPAVVRYLLTRNQRVIALVPDNFSINLFSGYESEKLHRLNINLDDKCTCKQAMKMIVKDWGAADMLINNCGYGLIDTLKSGSNILEIENEKEQYLDCTLQTIRLVLPFMKAGPKGHIISLPPKPCLDKLENNILYTVLAETLESFSNSLNQRLRVMDKKLTIIEPGVRFKSEFL